MYMAPVVQSLNCVWLFATPWTAARQASLSFTISRSLLRFMSIELVMLSNHLILCRPLFLLPSIFPSIRVFSNESQPLDVAKSDCTHSELKIQEEVAPTLVIYQKIDVACLTSEVSNMKGLSVSLQLGCKDPPAKLMCWVRHLSCVTSGPIREGPVGGQPAWALQATGRFKWWYVTSCPCRVSPYPSQGCPPFPRADIMLEAWPRLEPLGIKPYSARLGPVRDGSWWILGVCLWTEFEHCWRAQSRGLGAPGSAYQMPFPCMAVWSPPPVLPTRSWNLPHPPIKL